MNSPASHDWEPWQPHSETDQWRICATCPTTEIRRDATNGNVYTVRWSGTLHRKEQHHGT